MGGERERESPKTQQEWEGGGEEKLKWKNYAMRRAERKGGRGEGRERKPYDYRKEEGGEEKKQLVGKRGAGEKERMDRKKGE